MTLSVTDLNNAYEAASETVKTLFASGNAAKGQSYEDQQFYLYCAKLCTPPQTAAEAADVLKTFNEIYLEDVQDVLKEFPYALTALKNILFYLTEAAQAEK